MPKTNVIKSLIMKASEQYNPSEEERKSCLRKAEELSKKHNLFYEFEHYYTVYIGNYKLDKLFNLSGKDEKIKVFFSNFYKNVKGNYVLRIIYNNKFEYMTLCKCKNGLWGIFYAGKAKFNIKSENLFIVAFNIFTNYKMRYRN